MHADYRIVLLGITALLILSLGLVVFLRNTRSKLNRYYLGFTFFAALWIATNAIFQLGYQQYAMSLLSYGAAGFLALFTLAFVMKFTKRSGSAVLRSIAAAGIILSLASMLPGVVAEGVRHDAIITTNGLYLYGAYLLTCFSASVALLVVQYRQGIGQERVRSGLMLLGFFVAIMFGLFFNLILPLLGIYRYVYLGPVFILALVGCMGYAIVRHRLFDVRLVVARTAAYLLVTASLGLAYGLVVFQVVDRFFPGTQTTTLQQSIYALLAVFLAFTFQPLKRFFDRLTDRIFYQNRYDTEDVLNRLGKIFISKSNSFDLLDDSLKVIASALRVNSAQLVVLDGAETYRVATIGSHPVALNEDILLRFNDQVHVLDELEDSDLQDELRNLGAYTLVRLTSQQQLIGYLLLGEKRSGTIYTQQDVNLLEILSQELAVAIQNAKSYQEIQAFSETLKKEVDEATAQLRESNERLVKLDEAKDEFISMASHQLRTPLTTIKGYLSMLLEGDAGKLTKKQLDFIDLAFVSSERMVHLIADMLNVSRISTGRLTIDTAEFDLAAMVKEEVQQLERQAEARGVSLKVHVPKHPLLVNLDEMKIRQVVMNFTDNAIYYTPEGEVNVYVEQTDSAVEFRVEDTGIGVSAAAQKQLFTKFFRADNAQSVRPDGTGLGLYMAKQVIEAQGGELIFASQEGKGSTFGFRFNVKKSADPAK